MHTVNKNPAPSCTCPPAASGDHITLQRDPLTNEWIFDLSPGLDLLEVGRVLAVVQQHALELLQQQLHLQLTASAAPVLNMPIPSPTPNQFAQL